MDMEESQKIPFQVEIDRVLELLSKEIYDSPYALLRENIQNAYDAILMRSEASNGVWPISEGRIIVSMNDAEIIISDNGIGMTEDVIRNNFWKAGSSGKKTEFARRAGVIGTFGIGAMANFGVSSKLSVQTRPVNSPITIISSVEKHKLSLTEDCIDLVKVQSSSHPEGTTISVQLQPNQSLTLQQAIQYLHLFTRYLPVLVVINDTVISQETYQKTYLAHTDSTQTFTKDISENGCSAKLDIRIDGSGNVSVHATNLNFGEQPLAGDIVLAQGRTHIMGLRSYFGLAPVPVSYNYSLGGVMNLAILQPTAGREALSRDSIDIANRFVLLIEKAISETLVNTEVADQNGAFLSYIQTYGRYDLANCVKVYVLPEKRYVPMGNIRTEYPENRLYYYTGNDSTIIQTFSSGQNKLLQISNSNPRSNIQLTILNQMGIEGVPDQVVTTRIYSKKEITFDEMMVAVRILSVLNEDYGLYQIDVTYADISHGVPIYVASKGELVQLYLARNSPLLQPLIDCYKKEKNAFPLYIKDFVRSHIYQRVSSYVPTATREGVAAFQRAMQRRREEYNVDLDDIGDVESHFYDFSDMSYAEMAKESSKVFRQSTVTVAREQIGTMEQELHDVIHSPGAIPDIQQQLTNESSGNYAPAPPILRLETNVAKKLLTTDAKYPQLNNFQTFLSVYDRLFRAEMDYFLEPHSTRIIWGSHRVVYIFSQVNPSYTLYYDIELQEPMADGEVGGVNLPTTTIITKNRIFFPIPEQLQSAFRIQDADKKFYVRYDTISEWK